MRKILLLFLATILSFNCYSQISFEKGYYIDNNDRKINCLIKNIDWRNNPIEFEYKLSENSEPEKGTMKSVKEFGVHPILKYIRYSVDIDRSSETINNMSNDNNPLFNKEELFLKVLVEGKSNLYEYIDGNLKRYFYSKDNSIIEQLVFKSYKISESHIATNNRFRQQLWNDLKCPNFNIRKIENLDYKEKDLVRFFVDYSKCHNNDLINFEPNQKRDLFNLTIRPRLNSSSLTIRNPDSESRDTDFGNKTGFGIGLEAEFILPFNKNKWSVTIEPTYQSFMSEKTSNTSNVSGGILIAEVDYSSIEVPISLRHYLFLNKNSKIFVNISYIFDLSFKSSIEFKRSDNSSLNSLEIKPRSNFAFGIGYKFHDKYSLEMKYQMSRDILGNYISYNSHYKTLSIIFGYSLF